MPRRKLNQYHETDSLHEDEEDELVRQEDEIMLMVTAHRDYPGNGMLGILPWKSGETRTMSRSKFEKLLEDMPSGWVIRLP